MSNEAITWAYRQELPAGQKFVLVALADLADEQHSCFPGQEKLAAMTGQSARSVRRQLSELEQAGFIGRKRRFDGAGHRTSDRYVLPVSEIPTGQSDQRPERPQANVTSGQRDQRSDQPPAIHDSPTGHSVRVSLSEPPVTTPQPPASGGRKWPCRKHTRRRNACPDCDSAAAALTASKADNLAAARRARDDCSHCDPDGWAYDDHGEVTATKCTRHTRKAG